MEPGPYWKTTSGSAAQEFQNILCNPKVHYRVQRAFDWSSSGARWNQYIPPHPITLFLPPDKYENCRPQWPHGLRHEMSSLARTQGSAVRISFEAWMYAFFFSAFELSFVGSGLAAVWYLVQGVLPTVCKIYSFILILNGKRVEGLSRGNGRNCLRRVSLLFKQPRIQIIYVVFNDASCYWDYTARLINFTEHRSCE
jgi:hypothetical protein